MYVDALDARSVVAESSKDFLQGLADGFAFAFGFAFALGFAVGRGFGWTPLAVDEAASGWDELETAGLG